MAWAERRAAGLWRGCWRLSRSQPVQHTETIYLTREAAEAEGWIQERAQRTTAGIDPAMHWGAWCDTWLPRREGAVVPTSYREDQSRVRRFLRPKWGDWKLVAIDPPEVRDWCSSLSRTLPTGPATLNKIVWLFSASMTAAVEAGLIGANPCRGIRLPKPGERDRFYSQAEIDAIVDDLRPPWSHAVTLLVETGLRMGELAGLHTEQVDRFGKRLHVATNWTRYGVMGPTKDRDFRWVPISERAAAVLDELATPPASKCGLPHQDTPPCRSGLVLAGPDGAPLDGYQLLRRQLQPCLRRLGIPPGTVHDLRHTYASWLVQAGVPLSDVAEVLGHSDAYVTRRYAKLAGTHHARIRAALDGPRSAPLATLESRRDVADAD